jgi:hypothetical protein
MENQQTIWRLQMQVTKRPYRNNTSKMKRSLQCFGNGEDTDKDSPISRVVNGYL